MITRARVGLTAGVLVLAGALGGCGDDDDGGESGGNDFAEQGYDAVRDAAIEAMASLDSLHFSLNVSGEAESLTVELSTSVDGSCTGTVAARSTLAQVLRADGSGWFKPNLALLEERFPGKGEQAAEFVGDAWVVDTDDKVTGANCDLAGLVDSLSKDLSQAAAGTTPSVEGEGDQEVVRLDFSGERGNGSAYVLANGEHYIVSTARESIFATFSEFNEPVVTEAPAPGDVVDLADFPG